MLADNCLRNREHVGRTWFCVPRPAAILFLVAGLFAYTPDYAAADDKVGDALDKIFSNEDAKKLIVEYLEFEVENPLLKPEMRDAEQALAKLVEDTPAPAPSPDEISIDLDGDILLGPGDAGQTLVLFLDPGCDYCFKTLEFVVKNNDFGARNVIVKWTPSMGLPDYMVAMYLNCRLANVQTTFQRFHIALQLLSEKFKDRDITVIANAAVDKFGLNFDDQKECRTLDKARHLLENRIQLHRQCARIECFKGYTQVGLGGEVKIGFAPAMPVWFFGHAASATGKLATIRIESAGLGLTKLKEAFN